MEQVDSEPEFETSRTDLDFSEIDDLINDDKPQMIKIAKSS